MVKSLIIALVLSANSHANSEINCLALNIYHEARGESPQGQQAVAAVTINRVRSKQFPSSICSVVWQNKQFSWTHTQKNYYPENTVAWKNALAIAQKTISGDEKHKNILYFHNKSSNPYWTKSVNFVASVGNHLFYSK